MITKKQLMDWAAALHPESKVAIDDEGHTLKEIDKDGNETGNELTVGWEPRVGGEDFPSDAQPPSRTPTPGLTVECSKCGSSQPGLAVSPSRIECATCGTAI